MQTQNIVPTDLPPRTPLLTVDHNTSNEHFFENKCSELTQCTLACLCCVVTLFQVIDTFNKTNVRCNIDPENVTVIYQKNTIITDPCLTKSNGMLRNGNIVEATMTLVICVIHTKHLIKNRYNTYSVRSKNMCPDLTTYALISLLNLSNFSAYYYNQKFNYRIIILFLTSSINLSLLGHLLYQAHYISNSNIYRFMWTGQMHQL